ncbi:MAG: alanyl-tRNA editing protein [Eubacterium sp.]|nr:alanyl-tRNA editing protein [Candidatus Colimonas fimequi]
MTVKKLWQEDVYTKEWDAVITEVSTVDNGNLKIYLDQTAFFPEGGGQSCDLGFMNDMKVIDVQEDGKEVVHTVSPEGAKLPKAGDKVHCTLDWDHRFDNMQRHCGEHILSGICYDLFGGVNRGFHMGHDAMTIDISLEEDPKITELTYDMVMEAELAANRVIWSNAPVTVMRFETRKGTENLPLRKALAFDEDISIVCVGSPENAADCVACCGTHPATAGQVGLIKIFRVEKNKGMFRIFFEAGERALEAVRTRHDILYKLSMRYSSTIEDFPVKLKAAEDKQNATKAKLVHVTNALIAKESAELDAKAEESAENVIVHKLEVLSMDDAFNMAKPYMGKTKKLLMLYSIVDTSFILVSSGKPACGKLVKEYASFYNGKGGGNDVSARAIFTNEEDAMLFADLISKHLK